MTTIIEQIIGIYLAVALVVFLRMFFIGRRIARQVGVPIKMGDHIPSMTSDSLRWLYFVLWFGLKSFLDDLK
jgi:hypothetical protein